MRTGRIILTFFLILGVSFCAKAQMKILPRDKIDNVANPRLSPDSAAFKFDIRHIIAEPMNEDDAPSTFIFRFENAGDRILNIDRLVTTCSCASASIDKREVKPDESAEISVRYNPKGHPGRFERRVFVYASGEDDPAAVLKLTVNVENGKDLSGEWPVQMGPIRMRRSSVEFVQGGKAVEKLRFINLSGKPLKPQCEETFLPECLDFAADMVEDGQVGEIVISYDPSKQGTREQMKIILKGLGLPPTKATITVNLLSF
ncbi:MAG: DUF1573 domain-containing protein [Bacteroidales bacterium]|nr:DUF1573 domain-containing protein [Bacteroidales bacterium]